MILCSKCGVQTTPGAKFCHQCGTAVPVIEGASDPFIGRIIGNYRVISILGVGGMGKVYRAEQTKLHRTVCIKTLLPQFANDPAVVRRFEREGIATAAMRHPNIVGIFDYGRTDDGILYIIMEYVEGRTLRQIMNEEGALQPQRAMAVIDQILGALDEAHANNIIHRDLKPANVLVSRMRDGTDLVKVVDFGIAKLVGGDEEKQLTKTGIMVGTPGYMSPEQMMGQELDPTSDIYCAGVILWELLTGQKLFASRSEIELAQRHVAQAAPSPSSLAKQPLPSGLDEVTLRSLEKRPDRRFRSALEFRRALDLVRQSVRGAPASLMTTPVGATPMVSESLSGTSADRPTSTGMKQVPKIEDMAALNGLRGAVPDKLVGYAANLAKLATQHEKQPLMVAFAELGGHARLNETLDLAAQKAFLTKLMQDVSSRAEALGAITERLLGTCLVAVFGIPSVHEDDAERSVRAGYEMIHVVQEAARVYNQPFEFRVGVHTGQTTVALDPKSLSESQGVSEVLAVARRIAAVAPPNRMIITHAVERLAGNIIRATERPTIAGDEKLGVLHEVQGLLDASDVQREPMIGREPQAQILKAILDQVKARKPGGVMFVADAGLGKTRLLQEAKLLARERELLVVSCRGGRFTSSNPLDVVRQLVHELNATQERLEKKTQDPQSALSSLTRFGVPRADVARLERLFYGANVVVGESQKAEVRAADHAALLQVFLKATDSHTVVVLADDLHWADSASLEVFANLLERAGRHPFGLIATARPGNLDAILPRIRRIEIPPLEREHIEQIIRERLPSGKPGAELVEAIVKRADGNPLFAKEILISLLESRSIAAQGGTWVFTSKEDVLPESLAVLTAARLDKLSPQGRLLLRYAAVVGRSFPTELIAAAADQPIDVHAATMECVQRGLIAPSDGIGAYQFTQRVTHEAVLKRISPLDLKHLHASIGEAVERGVTTGGEDSTAAMGRHFLSAEQPRKAMKYIKASAEKFADRCAWQPAVEAYRLCLSIMQKEAAKLGSMSELTAANLLEVAARAVAIENLLAPERALDLANSMLELVPAERAHGARGELLRQRAGALLKMSRLVDAETALREALVLSQKVDDPTLLANLHGDLSAVLEARGQLTPAVDALFEGMKQLTSQRLKDKNLMWTYLNGLGRLHFRLGQHNQAQEFFENAQKHAQQVDSLAGEAKVLTNLAILAAQRLDTAAAMASFDAARELAERAGDRVSVLRVRYNRARVLLSSGLKEESERELDAVVEAARDIGWREGEAMASQLLSRAPA